MKKKQREDTKKIKVPFFPIYITIKKINLKIVANKVGLMKLKQNSKI